MDRSKGKILSLMFLFFMVSFGYLLSEIVSTVLFVERVGAEYLPYLYIGNAIIGTVVGIGIATIIGRIPISTLIQGTALTGGLILFALFLWIKRDAALAYPSYFMFSEILYLILNAVLIWDLSLKLFSPFDAKKNVGYFSFGAAMGGVAAGSTSSILSELIPTEYLMFVIIGSLAVTMLIAGIIRIVFRKDILERAGAPTQASSFSDLKEGFNAYRLSKLAKYLSLGLILFFIVKNCVDYEFQKILSESFDETRYAEVMGLVSMLENLALAFVFLFVQRWLFTRLGVVKALRLSPQMLLVPLTILVAFPHYIVACLMKITTKIVQYATFANSTKLMYTGIPQKVRSSVSTFIGATSQTAGTLAAGIVLAVLTRFIPNPFIIGIMILTTVILLVVTLKSKNAFLAQIKENLGSEDPHDVNASIENFSESEYRHEAIIELMKVLNKEETNADVVRKILFAFGKINNIDIIPNALREFDKHDITIKYAVIEMINEFTHLKERLAEKPFTRLAITNKYRQILIEEEDPQLKKMVFYSMERLGIDENISIVVNILKEKSDENWEEKMHALHTLKDFHDRGIIEIVEPYLQNKKSELKTGSIVALWQFTELRAILLKEFVKLNGEKDKQSILSTQDLIAELNLSWEMGYLEKTLKHRDEEIRLNAAISLIMLRNWKGLDDVVKALIHKNEHARIVAEKIKKLPVDVKRTLLKTIKQYDEESIHTFIDHLKETYYNFTPEIRFLRDEDVRLQY